MSNHLVTAKARPSSIASGASTQVDIEYESDNGGPIQFSSGAGFTVHPTSHAVSASPSSTVTVSVTITRSSTSTKNCRLVLSFYTSSRELLVEIT